MRLIVLETDVYRHKNRFCALALSLASAVSSMPVHSQSANVARELIYYPDFVFFNGQILTAGSDTEFAIAEALAVRGNRIFKVGRDEKVRPPAGPDTRVIDLQGRLPTPGFIYNDADNAVPAGDLDRFGVNVGSFMRQQDAEPPGIENLFEAQCGVAGLERVAPHESIVRRLFWR